MHLQYPDLNLHQHNLYRFYLNKLHIYKKRVDRVMNKMEKHVKIAHKKQDLLEIYDSKLFNYVNYMNVKYA